MLGSPRATHIQWFSGRRHGPHSTGLNAKPEKGKGTWSEEFTGNQNKLWSLPPSGVTQDDPNSPATGCDETSKKWSTQVSAQGGPNPRLPEGKQALHTNCIICMNSVGTENHPYQSESWRPRPRANFVSKAFPGWQSGLLCKLSARYVDSLVWALKSHAPYCL